MNMERVERSAATEDVRPKAHFLNRYTIEIRSANYLILKNGKSLNRNKNTISFKPSEAPQTPPAWT
jgi:hypothetical protein